MTLRAYSPSDDDFVENAFTTKRTRGSSKVDQQVSKRTRGSSKPAIAAKPSKPSGSSKPLGSSKPSKPSGSSKHSKPVLSEDLKPGLNLHQILPPKQQKFLALSPKNRYSMNLLKNIVGYKRKRTSKSPKTDDVDEQVADVHIDDIEEHQLVDPQPIDDWKNLCVYLNFLYLVHQLADDDIQMTGTNEDIQTTGTDENTKIADPMTGTDQTAENGNDEPSSSSIKLTQQQLSAMILEFQGEYSQFKSAEDGSEAKEASKETDEPQTKDGSEAKVAYKETDEPQTKDGSDLTDEPQTDKSTELTLTQMFMNPAFMKEYEKIERQTQRPEFLIFNTEQFQNKALVLYEEKKDPEQVLDELLKMTPFLHTSSEILSENIDDNLWKRIQGDTLEMKKTVPNGKSEEDLENIREKRKVKPSESLKSPYLQKVVAMKNKIQDIERKVADTIFAARGDLDDVLFHSYFIDGQRIHFESFIEGNEINSGVIDMWAYIHNMAQEKRNIGSLRKLYGHTSIINLKSIFLTTWITKNQSRIDIRKAEISICKVLERKWYSYYEALNNYKVANVKMPWQTKNNYIDCGIFAMRHMETYLGNKDIDAGFVKEVESEVEEYQCLPLREKRMLLNMSAKNIAERASDYFEREASAFLRQK
ncbi:Peptidase C48, SUMO/Sentrin/Ubl1 [Artemisia annua]|uniref:Peptidase C48, SUMO/Sentrin/Ubl1 n=1 Tax=Artemisia annua TaxID=35608 RepID=A0A2U1QN25_ARTAN|nr:Peptidase C48, SUMO/Sentrin/Ubl1 [Artemisia annua]